jgi:hypothetical protein
MSRAPESIALSLVSHTKVCSTDENRSALNLTYENTAQSVDFYVEP